MQKVCIEEQAHPANLEKFRFMFLYSENLYQTIVLQMIDYYHNMDEVQREVMVEGISKSLSCEPYLKSLSCEAYLNIMRLCFSIW